MLLCRWSSHTLEEQGQSNHSGNQQAGRIASDTTGSAASSPLGHSSPTASPLIYPTTYPPSSSPSSPLHNRHTRTRRNLATCHDPRAMKTGCTGGTALWSCAEECGWRWVVAIVMMTVATADEGRSLYAQGPTWDTALAHWHARTHIQKYSPTAYLLPLQPTWVECTPRERVSPRAPCHTAAHHLRG